VAKGTRGRYKLNRCILCNRLTRYATCDPLAAGWLVLGARGWVCWRCPFTLRNFPMRTLLWRGNTPLMKVSTDRREALIRVM
jgi:hypothetical protein